MSPVFDADLPKEHYVRIQPKSEAELAPFNLKDEYVFEVIAAQDSASKKGNEMIVLELLVHSPNGLTKKLKDYLLDAMAHKLRHFAYSCGLGDKYEAGGFEANDCVGRSGLLKFKEEKNEGYDMPRLVVRDYVEAEQPAPAPKQPVREVVKAAVPAKSDASEVPF